MFDMLEELARANVLLLLIGVLIFDIPRYTFSLLSLALTGVARNARRGSQPAGRATISVIVPAFNGGDDLDRAIAALHAQTLPPFEIIIVDDGSTDNTRAIAQAARKRGDIDMVVCHGTRCGRSAAINSGARFARGDLLLVQDTDTVFETTVLAYMAAVFDDPHVAAASCNIGVANENDSIWTGLQSIEYLMSISAGRSFLNQIEAIACCSGACSMYRRTVFLGQGGLDVGPGEDLEFTLRLRRLGYSVRFVPEAWALTGVPDTFTALLRQRARWDRDALRIRSIMYGEFNLRHPIEGLPDTLQRLDFIVFDLVPTLLFPFYVGYVVADLGPRALTFLAALYVLVLGISLFNLALTQILFNRSPGLFGFALAPIFPFYQGVIMKCARFVTYSAEILFASSRHDDFVPPRIRRALLGRM